MGGSPGVQSVLRRASLKCSNRAPDPEILLPSRKRGTRPRRVASQPRSHGCGMPWHTPGWLWPVARHWKWWNMVKHGETWWKYVNMKVVKLIWILFTSWFPFDFDRHHRHILDGGSHSLWFRLLETPFRQYVIHYYCASIRGRSHLVWLSVPDHLPTCLDETCVHIVSISGLMRTYYNDLTATRP